MPFIPDHFTILRSRIAGETKLRFTQGGDAVASFSVSSAKGSKNPTTGKWEVKARKYIKGKAWQQLAEHIAALPRGCPVVIVGGMTPDPWTDAQGTDRDEWELTAEIVAVDLRWVEIAEAGEGFVTLKWHTGEGRKNRKPPVPTGLEKSVGKTWDDDDQAPF